MSDLTAALVAAATDAAKKANAIVERVTKARATTSNKVVSDLRDKTDISEVPAELSEFLADYRAKVEKIDAAREKLVTAANEKVRAYVDANSSSENLTDEQINVLKKEHAEHRKTFRDAVKFAKSLNALSEEDEKNLPAVQNFGGSTSSTPGEGGRKPRFSQITVNGEDIFEEKDGKKIVTLTVLAGWMNSKHKGDEKWTKVTTAELFEHLSAENGSDDFSAATDISLGKFRGEYNVTVYPKGAAE